MVANSIEREVVIDAPAAVVWEVLTTPDGMSQWLGGRVEIDLTAGGRGALTFEDAQKSNATAVQFCVEEVSPPSRFVYRWDIPRDGARVPDSLRVEFTVEPFGESTRLKVVESGFLDLPESAADAMYTEHSHGWGVFLERFRNHAAQRVAG